MGRSKYPHHHHGRVAAAGPQPAPRARRTPLSLRPRASNGGGGDDWNREHVWAKSHGNFGTATGRAPTCTTCAPRDVTVNSTRGNKDFDMVGSLVAQAPGSYTDSDSFEPPNAVKGDVARMLLYMAVPYEGGDGFADLEMNDKVNKAPPRSSAGSAC
ncbi:endonuclease [Streptomyces sp. NPDC057686]|uniref:endonuclease n=1 Tax=Streptomyces sp. NPDC057686 TaxID=3346212 RepID=UPI00367C3316